MSNVISLSSIHLSEGDVKTNARVRYLPDENGEYKPYEILAFPKLTFVKPGYEISGASERSSSQIEIAEVACASEEFRQMENKRKSYCRARNKLFDLLMCTTTFDCFVTLTLSSGEVDRYDYKEVIKKLNVWLANRVSRRGLVYALVPEFHKDGAVHFHGLMNSEALSLVRACNAHTQKPLFDDSGRDIYNISDFGYGFTTVILLSGENARINTAKYCYKYITKSKGEKVGGRYYLSGGKLGRPKYKYVNIDYEKIPTEEQEIKGATTFKKYRSDGQSLENLLSDMQDT